MMRSKIAAILLLATRASFTLRMSTFAFPRDASAGAEVNLCGLPPRQVARLVVGPHRASPNIVGAV